MRIPPPDLDVFDELVVLPDAALGDRENICRAENRHLRLVVAGWMMSDGTSDGNRRALRDAYHLYDSSGRGLLDRPGQLSLAQIVAEVLQLSALQQGAA